MPIVGAPSTTAQVILDPVTEDAANVELVLTDDSNYGLLAHAYPTPSVAPQWASSVDTEGSLLSAIKHENRTITVNVDVSGLGALHDLEAKVAKLYREGGTYKRVYSDGREIVFDVLTVTGYEPLFEQLHHFADITPVTINLECRPYGRGAEQDLGDNVETTLPILTFTEASIPGDIPARGRLVIDNDEVASNIGWGVWGIRSRYYSSAASAALFYQAEACAGAGGGAVTAVGPAGASGSGNNVMRHTGLIAGGVWMPLSWIGPSSTAQTHAGDYRVFARFQAPATNAGTVSVRMSWSPRVIATGTPSVIVNTAVPLVDASGNPIEGSWVLADLGMVSIPKARVGNQGWLGLVEATSTSTGDDIDMDYIMLVPAGEGYGEFTANVGPGLSVQVGWDGVFRSVAGGYWVDPTKYEGDLLLVPPSGAEGRTLEMLVKTGPPRLSNAGVLSPDSVIGDISARLYATPRYLTVPA